MSRTYSLTANAMALRWESDFAIANFDFRHFSGATVRNLRASGASFREIFPACMHR